MEIEQIFLVVFILDNTAEIVPCANEENELLIYNWLWFISQPVLQNMLTDIWFAFHVSFDIQRPFFQVEYFR